MSIMKEEYIPFVDELIELAIREDIGDGDHSSLACIPHDQRGRMKLLVKQDGILAGVEVARRVLRRLDPEVKFEQLLEDGTRIKPGDIAFYVEGRLISLLQAERILLNIMQRMSGVATQTAVYVQELDGLKTQVIDTRKTTPGMRVLDKMAVRIGGGGNHRIGLFDMVILKDNHIDAAGSMTKAVELLRGRYNPCPPIEVECRNLDEISEAVACRVDRIMLDNMTPDMLPEALEMIPSFIETEISGGVSLDTIRAYATVSTVRKPDFISVGRITHSAVTADLSMRIAKESL